MPCHRTANRSPSRLAATIAAWLALVPFASFASDPDRSDDAAWTSPAALSAHGWRFAPLSQMLEQSQRQRLLTKGMPRLLPVAMMPMQQSALWLGLDTSRNDVLGEPRIRWELRWSMPLDRIGPGADMSSLALRGRD